MTNEIIRLNMGMVNSYLIKASDGFILVDTGIPMNRKTLEAELEKNGCTAGKLKLIIITHGDIDHIGSAAYLRQKFGAKIVMGKQDAYLAETATLLSGRKQRTFKGWFRSIIFGMTGLYKRVASALERFAPDIYPEDGYSLTQYGVDAKIISIPGHTPGSIGVILANGDLICGDTINNRKKPFIGEIVYNEGLLNKSVEKIRALDVKTIYPGHGRPFKAEELFKES